MSDVNIPEPLEKLIYNFEQACAFLWRFDAPEPDPEADARYMDAKNALRKALSAPEYDYGEGAVLARARELAHYGGDGRLAALIIAVAELEIREKESTL